MNSCLFRIYLIAFTFHSYIMQMASMNSCLFRIYPIALTSKADSHEDAPFCIAPFISFFDSGVNSSSSSLWLFQHFVFLWSYSAFHVPGI